MKAVRIRVTGKVQGVFYRHSAQQEAKLLGINGFIRNESDGSVYAEAEGEETVLQQFVDWIRNGPPSAKVTNVEVSDSKPSGVNGFTIQ